jgi:hypothetical protein
MAEKLDLEAKRLRKITPGELADAIGRRELHRAEGQAYRIANAGSRKVPSAPEEWRDGFPIFSIAPLKGSDHRF